MTTAVMHPHQFSTLQLQDVAERIEAQGKENREMDKRIKGKQPNHRLSNELIDASISYLNSYRCHSPEDEDELRQAKAAITLQALLQDNGVTMVKEDDQWMVRRSVCSHCGRGEATRQFQLRSNG